MLIIKFLYGISFILLGMICFVIPKKRDLLNISRDIPFLGLFGLTHGIYDILPFLELFNIFGNSVLLRFCLNLLFPVSFLFLVVFSCRIICRLKPRLRWVRFYWIIALSLYGITALVWKNPVYTEIAARYLICLPGSLLAALGIYISFLKLDKKQLPVSFLPAVFSLIAGFVLYGFFGGLLGPYAAVFPVSLVNSANFCKIFHLPVQIFRMGCALLTALGTAVVIGLYKHDDGSIKLRGGIKGRIAILISSVVIIMTFGILSGYVWGFYLLYNTIGENYVRIAESVGENVSAVLNKKIDYLEASVNRSEYIVAAKNSNKRYDKWGNNSPAGYFARMDRRWLKADLSDKFIKGSLANSAAIGLKEMRRRDSDIGEIFITDTKGGLVAASNKTTDFYQADESWWQDAFDNGRGRVYVGDAGFDKSCGKWSVTLAFPIRGHNGDVYGICKAVMNVDNFFKAVPRLTAGVKGRVELVDETGWILFHHGKKLPEKYFFNSKGFSRAKMNEKKWVLLDEKGVLTKKIFVAFAEVNNSFLGNGKNRWRIMIVEDEDVVFRPLVMLALQAILVIAVLFAVIIPFGYYSGGWFLRPIQKFIELSDHISRGDLDYQVQIKTGDEIEVLANAFKKMCAAIKQNQEELKQWSEGLEKKVLERTIVIQKSRQELESKVKYIEEARKASLNIMEDLDEERAAIKKAYKELQEMQEKLIRTEKLAALGRLAGSISHELRNPLGVIRNAIYYLNMLDLGKTDKNVKDTLALLDKEICVSDKIIGDILEFSRIKKAVFSRGNINDIIKKVLFESKMNFKDTVKIVTEFDASIPDIDLDPVQIERLFINLILNAMDAMEKGGQLGISTAGDGGFVKADFLDTGCGVLPENISKMFEPLFTTKAGGVGFGLAICQSIVDAHKGAIGVKSEVGKGTIFTVKLPIKYTEEQILNTKS